MGINNPLPSSLASECRKCGKILASFVDPKQAFGPDKIIPPSVLAQAKGLAIMTVIKAGFLGSARYGNGVVVARLADGSWSAPSAIGTAGFGFGGQIGAELTDFVFILNDAAAVRTFSHSGSITLGGNVSVAAGPIGRNAEAAGAASAGGLAGIFSYSKTKGLFAGVSLEGSAIVERKDANEKLYGQRLSGRQLLEGAVRPPPAAAPLMSILNSRVFSGVSNSDAMYNDIPVYDERHDDVVWEGRRGSGMGEGVRRSNTSNFGRGGEDFVYNNQPPQRSSTWQDDVYDRGYSPSSGLNSNPTGSTGKAGPGRPTAPKPQLFRDKTGSLKRDEAVALFTFDAEQSGDLGFKKGDVITVTKKTDNASDWWTGRIGDRTGIFPSNYVQMKD